jgi:F0F1-type ATP synthase membrane subunit b/b'
VSRIVIRGAAKRVKRRSSKKAVARAESQLAQLIAANHRETLRILRDVRRDIAQCVPAPARKAKRK